MFGIPLQTRQNYGYMFNDNITTIEEAKEDLSKIFKTELNLKEFKFKPYHASVFLKDRVLKPDENYVIVDANRWLKIKNGSGKTVRIIPPQKHNYNSGEYHYTDLGEIIPKTGFNESKQNELEYLTNNINNYFNEIKLFQYNDSNNIKWIKNALLREFSSVLGGEKEKIKASLLNDKEYLEATNIILNNELYKEIINP